MKVEALYLCRKNERNLKVKFSKRKGIKSTKNDVREFRKEILLLKGANFIYCGVNSSSNIKLDFSKYL